MIERRGHLHDAVVLHVQFEVAADPAVGADGRGDGLLRLVPVAGLPHLVLAGEHERAGGADPDAVAAVHAGRVGQADVELGGDAGVDPAACDSDREGVLRVLPAGFDALVAQDAARVVADVAVVVVLDRLGDRVGLGALRRVVLACPGRVTFAGGVRPRRWAVPAGVGAVLLYPAPHLRRANAHVHPRGHAL